MNAILQEISQTVNELLEHPTCVGWLKTQKLSPGDILLINNSFVFRDVKTNKSDSYLAVRFSKKGHLDGEPMIAQGVGINSDFKLISTRSRNIPQLTALQDAVRKELSSLGLLVFVLIGQIDDNVILQQSLDHPALSELTWDPSAPSPVRITRKKLVVQDASDEDAIWAEVEAYYRRHRRIPPGNLREALGNAIDKLQDKAVARLSIPKRKRSSGPGMTDAIVHVLKQQRDDYATALHKLSSRRTSEPSALNEVLRMAYNFTSDAITYLRLVVSVCDLKPVVLWGTISQHYALSDAIRNLPWERSRLKPSLKNYTSIVADARNAAFHSLFPFRKTLEVNLPEAALHNASLRIFSEHGHKKRNELTFQDKELVDVLFEFTRARYRQAPLRFWQQNVHVMDSTISLFEKTSGFLKLLHKSSPTS